MARLGRDFAGIGEEERARLLRVLERPRSGRLRALARPFHSVAVLAFAVGDVGHSVRWVRRGLRFDPDDSALLSLAARLAGTLGAVGPVLDQHAGLINARGVDLSLLAAVLRRAEACPEDPAMVQLVAEHGRSVQRDAVAAGERLVALEPDRSICWYLLARARIDDAYDRGAQTEDEVGAIRRAFHTSLDLDSGDPRSSFHLVRSYVSTGEWAEAFAVATAGADVPRREEIIVALDAPAEELVSRYPMLKPDAWYVIHAEVLGSGAARTAARAKDAMAECVVERTGSYRTSGLGPALGAVRALAHLGRLDDAAARVQSLAGEDLPERERVGIQRLVDDLAFRGGALRAPRWPEVQARVPPQADGRFRSLVEGRTIAVVGPSVTDDHVGEQIDDHDVVIRTKFVSGRATVDPREHGRRTDVSYYTDSSARFFRHEIRSALDAGELQMAILRPSAFRAERWPDANGRVRYVPGEDTVPFQGTHFAIQRILYDLLHYEPRRISLFNVDFFTGDSSYVPGYASEVGDVYEPNRFRPIVSTVMHDLREDFLFTQMLVQRGLVTATPAVASVLALETEAYLEAAEPDRPGGDKTPDIVR